MKTWYLFLIAFVCYGLYQAPVSAQSATSNQVPLVVRPQPGKILLRWGPGSDRLWRLANRYGYYVERSTTHRDNVALSSPQFVRLTTTPLLPADTATWRPYRKNDSLYHYALYSALYGPDPNLTADSIVKVTHNYSLTYLRWFSALMAADQHYGAARMAALGYVDATAKSNERYQYRITTAIPADSMTVVSPAVAATLTDYRPLPAPTKPSVGFVPKEATLRWKTDTARVGYISYWVERSTNGTLYSRRNTLPFMNVGVKDSVITYKDSVARGRRIYYYRVKGQSLFGEVGTSDVVYGQSKDSLTAAPVIKSTDPLLNGGVRLSWQFPGDTVFARADTLLKSFYVAVSPTAQGNLVPVKVNVAPTDTATVVTNYYRHVPAGAAFYLTVVALRRDGDTLRSVPVLVQPADTLAPSVPKGLRATVTPQGIVSLTWDPNPEPDLLGYKVFRGHLKGEETSAITPAAVPVSTLSDTLDAELTNEAVYYQIRAIDARFNESALSERVELLRPDKTKPAAPRFLRPQFTQNGVRLRWITSSSRDVARHLLFKKEGEQPSWQALPINSQGDTTYLDVNTQPSRSYRYLLLAQDRANLYSDSSAVLLVEVPASAGQSRAVLASFNAQVNVERDVVELSWSYDATDVAEFQLYRAVGNARSTLLKMTSGAERTADDDQARFDSTYRYSLRAFFKDGSTSNWLTAIVQFRPTASDSANQVPYVAQFIPAQSATLGQPFTYQLPTGTFADRDGQIQQVRIEATGLPAGLTVSTSQLSGTPTVGGTYTVTARATDNRGATAATTFSLRVNTPPSLVKPLPNATFTVGQTFSYPVPGTGSFADYDGTVATVEVQTASLPTGVTASAGVLSGTLSGNGPYTVTLRVADNEGATAFFPLVLTGNQPPVVQQPIAGLQATVGDVFTYTIPANTFRDPENGRLTVVFLPDSLPGGLGVQGATVTGRPLAAGQFTLRAQARDSLGAARVHRIPLLVQGAANKIPVVAGTLPVQTAFVGQAFQYTVPTSAFYDEDGTIAAVTLTGTPSAGLTLNGAKVQGTPTASASFNLTATATDNSGATVNTPLTVNVVRINQAPVVANSIPAQTATIRQAYTFTLPTNAFSDPDGTIASRTILPTGLPAGLTASGATLSGTPTVDGPFILTAQGTDNDGATVTTTFTLNVYNPGRMRFEFWKAGSAGVAKMMDLNGGEVINMGSGFPNTFNIHAIPDGPVAGVEFSGSSNRTDQAAPYTSSNETNGQSASAGVYNFTIKSYQSGSGQMLSQQNLNFVLNKMPYVNTSSPLSAQRMLSGRQFTYVIPSTAFKDDDGTITIQVVPSTLPSWLTANGPTLTGTAPMTAGTFTLTVRATDNYGAYVETQLIIEVISLIIELRPGSNYNSSTPPLQILNNGDVIPRTGLPSKINLYYVFSGTAVKSTSTTITGAVSVNGDDISAPFTASQSGTGFTTANGTYQVTVRFYDNIGRSGTPLGTKTFTFQIQ